MKLQFFKCEHCGNIAVKLFDEGPALFCCGEKMSELVPDSVEASHEKHIPVIDFVDGVVRVKVGEEPHPMIDTHWINHDRARDRTVASVREAESWRCARG